MLICSPSAQLQGGKTWGGLRDSLMAVIHPSLFWLFEVTVMLPLKWIHKVHCGNCMGALPRRGSVWDEWRAPGLRAWSWLTGMPVLIPLTPTHTLVLLLNSAMVHRLRPGVDIRAGPRLDAKEREQHCTLRPRSLTESGASCLQHWWHTDARTDCGYTCWICRADWNIHHVPTWWAW